MATCQHGYYQAAGNHGFLQLGFNQDYPTNHQVGLFTDNQSRSKEKNLWKKSSCKVLRRRRARRQWGDDQSFWW